MGVRLGDGIAAGIALDDLIARIGERPIGLVPVSILDGAEHDAAADVPAAAEVRVQHLTVAVSGRAALHFQLQRLSVGLQHEIEHAGDGV